MISNNLWIKNKIFSINNMVPRIYFLIHYWWAYRNLSLKFISRYYSTRYILCSSSLSLRPKHRSCICYFCLYISLIPNIPRNNTPRTMNKSSIYYYIYWSQHNIFSTTFSWTKRNAAPIFRLPR